MFDRTRGTLSKTVDDLKRIAFLFSCITYVFQIVYLIYALCTSTGILVANIALLIATSVYFLFILYQHWHTIKKDLKKVVKNTYRWGKHLIKLFTLGVSIYGVFVTLSAPLTATSAISLIMLLFSILSWTLFLLFDILAIIVKKRVHLIVDAVKADTEFIWKASNFINKLKGKDVEEEIVSAESRQELDKIKAEYQEKKKAQKREERKNFFQNTIGRLINKK